MPFMNGHPYGRGFAILGKLALVSLCVLMNFSLASGQAPVTEAEKRSKAIKARAYETQQRARRLLQLDAEIRSLPDAEVRGQLRFSILQFIYTDQARSEYAEAEFLLTTFLEDLAANENEVAHRAGFWRNSLALMLRKQAPETAKRIGAKYVPVVDTSGADQQELRNPKADKKAIIERAIGRVRSGENILSVQHIFEFVKRSDVEAADRIILAVLDRAEKHPSSEAAYLLYRLIDFPLNPPSWDISQTHRMRYYRSLVAGAEMQLSQTKTDPIVSATTALRNSLHRILVLDSQLYSEARSVIQRHRATLPKDDLALDEGFERIEASDDRLKQTIAEAEAATVQHVKDRFWTFAATLAVLRSDFRQAADLIMKASPDLGVAGRPNGRDEEMLSRVVLHAFRRRNYDAANYAIDNIRDRLVKAKAMLDFGLETFRWEEKERDQSVAMITYALNLMEEPIPDPEAICRMVNARTPLVESGRESLIPQIFTRRAVAMINRIPTTGIETKPGTPERAEFVSKTLVRGLSCVGFIFRPVANGKIIPDPDLAGQITVKEWRLAAVIEAEKARKYPLPQSPTDK